MLVSSSWCYDCAVCEVSYSFFFFRAKLSNRTVRMGRFCSAPFSVVAPNHKWPGTMAGETEKLNILFHFITILKKSFKKKNCSILAVHNLATKQQGECVLSCVWLCEPVNCSPPGSSVHGISQARILEWVAISFSRGSFWPRDRTHASCIGRWIHLHWAIWGAYPLLIPNS